MNTKWTKEKTQYLQDNYKTKTHKEMAQYLNCKVKAVSWKCEQLHLKKGSGRTRNSADIYKCNDQYFKTWSVRMAYIVGFISADGHISDINDRNRMSIGLNKKDISILEFIKKEICTTAKIRHYDKQDSVYLSISGKTLINSLREIGLDHKKSNLVSLFTKCPKKYHKDLISGFFDGDGCIYWNIRQRGKYSNIANRVSFVNLDYAYLDKISSIIDCGSILKVKNYYVLQISNYPDISRFFTDFYSSKEFRLERKIIKFKELILQKGV